MRTYHTEVDFREGGGVITTREGASLTEVLDTLRAQHPDAERISVRQFDTDPDERGA